jgi:hypothetical protein
MKTMIVIYLLLWPSVRYVSAQAIYTDPTTSAAMALHASVINGQLDKTNNKLTLIAQGQLAVTGQLAVANDLQQSIFRGLSQVSSALRSVLALKDMVEVGNDISRDIAKALAIANKDPALLLFAESGAREFQSRAITLAAEVSAFELAEGKMNLMDSGERAKLLNKLSAELMILRGVAYGMYRSMYWADQRGLLNALNPYAGFINLDNRIADDVLKNSKLVK